MSFSIRFKEPSEPCVFGPDAGPGREGVIRIGSHMESFFSVFAAWTEEDYALSWAQNLQELRKGCDAFFLTDVGQGDSAPMFFVWPAFHLGGLVYFTEKLLLRANADGDFALDNVADLIDFQAMRLLVGGKVSFFTFPAEELGSGAD